MDLKIAALQAVNSYFSRCNLSLLLLPFPFLSQPFAFGSPPLEKAAGAAFDTDHLVASIVSDRAEEPICCNSR
jgi:hypothetical protein